MTCGAAGESPAAHSLWAGKRTLPPLPPCRFALTHPWICGHVSCRADIPAPGACAEGLGWGSRALGPLGRALTIYREVLAMITCIRDGLIYDGGLGAPVRGELWISDDRIIAVGAAPDGISADRVIDAQGRVLCPGFVDMHRHPDVKPFCGWTGEVELRQGITTTVAGNCGISMTPASAEHAKEQYEFDEPVLGPMCANPPATFPEYLDALEKRPLPINMAAMIGAGSVRISIKGFASTPFSPDEMDRARRMIAQALDAGAPGVSLGIMYLPECYGTTGEYARMLEPVGERGAIIATHIRGEGDSMVSSVAEVIEIARRAGCALEISHFKSCGVKNWRRDIHRAIALIEQARARGQQVSCDFYPYEGGSTALTTMLPPDFVRGDMASALARLGTPEGVEEFRASSRREYDDWDNFALTLGWQRILISGVTLPEHRAMLGMDMVSAAERFGYADAEALAAHLMHSERGRTAIINMSMCQDDIDAVARLPYSAAISDAIYADTDTPHPRMFGAMPKLLREYVRERGVLTMQQAIHKLTRMPAERMGLVGRGTLERGAFADVLMFDPARFTDHATFSHPAQLATGLDMVMINGCEVLRDDVLLQSDAGRCLRRSYK